MRHKATGMGYKLDNLIRQQIGLDRGYTVAFDSFHLLQRFHQVKESLSRCLAKITDIHSGQDNFFSAFGGSLPMPALPWKQWFRYDSARGQRNGTIGTEVIATVLYFQEKARTVTP